MINDPKDQEIKLANSKSTAAKAAQWLSLQPLTHTTKPLGTTLEVAQSAVDTEFLALSGIRSGEPNGRLLGFGVRIVPDFRITNYKGKELGHEEQTKITEGRAGIKDVSQ